MRIDINRLSKLAGLSSNSSRSTLNEGAYHEGSHEDEAHEGMYEVEDEDADYVLVKGEKNEGSAIDGLEPVDETDEVYEIDEADLVMELRRAKRLMEQKKRKAALNEARKRQRKQALYEAQLKKVIDQEVKAVLQDLNLNSGWVYGNNKPRRSRAGYSHQGSYLKGLGFK